jgi:hypothetical protein
MKTWILLLVLFLVKTSYGQETEKKYSFREIGWTIILPEGFKTADSIEIEKVNEKGMKLVEESSGISMGMKELRTLIAANKDAYNYFNSTIRKFNPAEEGNYDSSTKIVKEVIFKTFVDNMPGAKLDSSTSIATIDEVVFDKFKVRIIVAENIELNMVLLSKLYKGYDFGISYLYIDELNRNQIESMLNKSKFEK